MKRIIRYIILLVVLCVGSFLLLRTVSGIRHKEVVAATVKQLPSLTFPTVNNSKVNIKNWAQDHAAVIIYFSPDCEHCQYEATELQKHLPDFQGTEIIMITRANAAEAKQFAKEYKLENISNIHFLLDPTDAFYRTFGTHEFPSIFIYDKSHRLIKRFIGETKIEAIISVLK